MSDELSNVQAKQGVNPLWGLSGAVIGGGATAYGLQRYGYSTKPYKSTADLIKEKEDTFNGKKLVAQEQVNAQEKAKSLIENAGNKYDADLKAYQEVNKFGYKESPELNSLVEQKNALEKEIAELGKETVAEPVSKPVSEKKARKIARKTFMNGGNPPVADNSQYLKVKQEQLANVKQEIEAEKNRLQKFEQDVIRDLRLKAKTLNGRAGKVDTADKKGLNKAKKSCLEYEEKTIDPKIKEYIDKMYFTGTKEEIAIAKDAKYKEMQEFIQSVVAEHDHNSSIVKVDVNKIAQTKNDAANVLKDLTKSVITKENKDKIKVKEELPGVDLKEAEAAKADVENLTEQIAKAKKDGAAPKEITALEDKLRIKTEQAESFQRRIDKTINSEQAKINKLEELLNLYKKYTEGAKAAGQKPATFKEFTGKILDKNGNVSGEVTITEKVATKARALLQDGLNDKQKDAFERLAGEGDEKAIQKAIETHQNNINAINKAVADINSANAKIVQYGGKGAIIKDGAIVRADGSIVEFKAKQVEIKKQFTVPQNSEKLVELEKTLAKLEAQINGTQPEVKLNPEQLAEKKSQLEELNSKINTLKNELKVERKPEELVTEFAEKNGSKRDAIIKALNEGKEELKPLLEKKWGTGKVATAIAGLAAVGGLLGYMIAPKHKA